LLFRPRRCVSLNRFRDQWQNLKGHRLARNAYWILAGQGINFFLQAAYFVLLARLLGVTQYGVFAGAFALVTTVTPYSTLGYGLLFMRYVSSSREDAGVYWGNAMLTTAVMSIIIAAVLSVAGPAISKTNGSLMVVELVFANCLFGELLAVAGKVFQTYEKMRLTATVQLLSSLARLIVLIVMRLTMKHASALQWSTGVLIASGTAALITVFWMRSTVGAVTIRIGLIFKRAWEGLVFSFAGSSQTVYNDFDKTLLNRYGYSRENGFYTLAYRIIDFSTAPITALEAAVLPRYFQLSDKGFRAVAHFAWKTLRISLALGVAIAAILLLTARIIPVLVGHDFAGVLIALRWLCWIPLLRGIHRIVGNALTATAHQKIRTTNQFIVAAINIALNLWWLPVYGWIGAAWSSVVCDGLLCVLNVGVVLAVWRRTRGQLAVAN
jgi:O-antigen/teichoic acid export membrane protein